MEYTQDALQAYTPPYEPPPKKPKPPSSEDRLSEQLQKMENILQAQRVESDRKIQELQSQNILLKKSFEENMAKLQSLPSADKSTPQDANNAWDALFGKQTTKTEVSTEGKKDDMTEAEVQKIIDAKLQSQAQAAGEWQQAAKKKEEELINRFRSKEYADLHNHGEIVAKFWLDLQEINPNLNPDVRFQKTIEMARAVVPKNGLNGMPTGGQPSNSMDPITQPKGKQLSAIEMEMQEELLRRKNLEEHVRGRLNKLHAQRGFDMSLLNQE